MDRMTTSRVMKCGEWFFGKERLKSCIPASEVRGDGVGLIMGLAGGNLEAPGRDDVGGRVVIVYY
jgi:hypothetical protein